MCLQSASKVIDFVTDFVSGIVASNSSNSSSLSSLGVGNSSKSTITIDLDLENLANNTLISAGFDVSFRLGVSFKVSKSLLVYLFATSDLSLTDYSLF
jgi:hypothetical protein